MVFDCGSHLLAVSQATKHCHCLPASCQGACRKFVTLCGVHSYAEMWERECFCVCWCECIHVIWHRFKLVCVCVCLYRVVFSAWSSAVKFPVLPPPPSSFFPCSDLKEDKRDLWVHFGSYLRFSFHTKMLNHFCYILLTWIKLSFCQVLITKIALLFHQFSPWTHSIQAVLIAWCHKSSMGTFGTHWYL